MSYIPYQEIQELLEKSYDREYVREVLAKAKGGKGLDTREVAALLLNDDEEIWSEAEQIAKEIKKEIYGSRLVIFAPLYLTNTCHNDCLYCAFRRSNSAVIRKKLTREQITNEVQCLEGQGHKRLLLVCGEETS